MTSRRQLDIIGSAPSAAIVSRQITPRSTPTDAKISGEQKADERLQRIVRQWKKDGRRGVEFAPPDEQ